MGERYIIVDCPDRKGFVNYINTKKFEFSRLSAVPVGMNKIFVTVWEGLSVDVIDGAIDMFGGFYDVNN